MSVDTDLASLREQLEKPWCPNLGSCPPEMHSGCCYCAAHDDAVSALARVEDELSRLREQRDAARGELRETRGDRDEGWRQHNQAEIGRLNAEAKLRRAIATLEYMGGAELVVDELRHGSLPEPSEDEAWEKRSRER